MRWDQLFADLEARFAELADADAVAELADRERLAVGAVRATQRLSGSIGRPLRLQISGGSSIGGVLETVGPDWLLLTEAQGRDCLVTLDAITAVFGLTTSTGPEIGGVALRLDLRKALRGLARDRSPVAIALTGWSAAGTGSAVAGSSGSYGAAGSSEITGTIDRVGADFVEIAVHAAWEPRRAAAVRSVALVPLSAVVLVRSLPLG
jgi:hypothetical protein